MKDPVNVTVVVESKRPILLGLSLKCKPVGFMCITDKVEFSINNEVWVDYAEGICECGMALKWDGVIVL